jgi:putative phosphoserine phosphatase/1-acylglycerol-3-phosphate O-acyltransferase
MIAAVFDLDRTLLPGTTAERIFVRYLVRNRVIGFRSLVATMKFAWKVRFQGVAQQIRAARPYLTGLHDADLRVLGRRCTLNDIFPSLAPRLLEAVQRHREMGHTLVMLSGSLPYVVEPLAQQLGFDEAISSQLAVQNQRLVGGLSGLHPYGEAKASLMQECANALGIDLSASWCYADHHSDESLLRMFGYPICVNPSERLRKIADCRGWRIERFCTC